MSKRRSIVKVFVAIPNSGYIHIQLANKITEMVLESFKTKKYEVTIRYSQVSGIDHNRNMIVSEFLKTDCQWLLMIDDDNPPLNNPIHLIKYNKDVVVCPTLMYKGGEDTKIAFNVFKEVEGGIKTLLYDGVKLVEIDKGGTGCILIKRKVLENIDKPFETLIDPKTGCRILGEDMAFSVKAKEKGYKIWCHWDYTCSHFKNVDLMAIAKFTIDTINKETECLKQNLTKKSK